MEKIQIRGYKSLKDVDIELKSINILIGANGAGKSNFVSFFDFLNQLYERKLTEYVALNGGMEKFIHKGMIGKRPKILGAKITFEGGTNEYSFRLVNGIDSFIFNNEKLWYEGDDWEISEYKSEAKVKFENTYRAKYIKNHLSNFRKYHFHDTGKNSPFTLPSNEINDGYFFYEDGRNIAAFLYNIKKEKPLVYKRIVRVIQSIAPFFSDFFLQANEGGHLRLQWQDKFSSTIYGASDLSDGTIRFVALTTLFMQPNLPDTIIIDEPELGLHPLAISKLAGMIQGVGQKGTQVIVATQSSDLVSHFNPENVLTVDLVDGESIFKRLNEEDLSVWMEDYSLGDLWKRSIISGGQP